MNSMKKSLSIRSMFPKPREPRPLNTQRNTARSTLRNIRMNVCGTKLRESAAASEKNMTAIKKGLSAEDALGKKPPSVFATDYDFFLTISSANCAGTRS